MNKSKIDFSNTRVDAQYTVRLEPQTQRKIQKISAATGTAMASVIRKLIKHSLANVDSFGQPIK